MLQRPKEMSWSSYDPPRLATGANERVLIIDDSRAQRTLLASLLKKWGHDVVACADATEAMAHADDPTIGLIISDWMMPGMSGPEFCRKFRELRREGYAYIILLTSKSEASALSEGLEAGADDFLQKPVCAPELRARLNAGARIVAMQREVMEKNRLLTAALGEIQSLYAALDHDLDEARRLQQSLLQDKVFKFGSIDVSLWLKAAGHVGGDMVGFFPVNEQVMGAFSLDVSGHGVASAMIAARVAGMLSAASPDQNVSLERQDDGSLLALPPHVAATRLNTTLLRELRTDRYFTMCLAFMDKDTGRIRMVQAGHPYPMILRKNGQVEEVGDGGLPIGLVEDADFASFEVTLAPGDRLFIYSDGLTECPDASGVALEEEGLKKMLVAHQGLTGTRFLEAIERELTAFAGGDDYPDDASALVMEFQAEEGNTAQTLK